MIAAAEFTADAELARHIAVVKSGHYTIHRPLVLGTILAGRPEFTSAFTAYGKALGEAFQFGDDLIDAFGVGDNSGKPAGLDFDQHKMTLLRSLAIQQDQSIRALMEEGRSACVRRRLIEQGVDAQVEAHIGNLVVRAQRNSGAASMRGS